jgi:very-short-patch-repair endonuclease
VRDGQKLNIARALRRNATEAEKIIWRLLRDRRLDRVKFRRQVPVGPFIADFASVEHRLIVEVDGSQHADSIYDADRTSFLTRSGWRVVRFWNSDVIDNTEVVWESIRLALADGPTQPRSR